MTLLFFLRSSNGSTAPANTTINDFYDDDVPLEPFKKNRKEGTVKQFEYDKKIKLRREEEDLILLLLKKNYDD